MEVYELWPSALAGLVVPVDGWVSPAARARYIYNVPHKLGLTYQLRTRLIITHT